MGADVFYEGPKYKEEQKLWEEYNKIKDSDADESVKEHIRLRWIKSTDQLDEDYFRDSYNNSSVLWQMGLSWWNDVGTVLDKEGRLPIDEAIKLRKIIQEHPIIKEKIEFKDFGCDPTKPFTEKDREEWFQYFVEKRKTFLKMLDRSIEFNAPLICSV